MSGATFLRRVLGVIAACVLLASRAEAATRLTADFDGDGKNDSVTIDRSNPSVIHFWLSRTGTTNMVRLNRAVIRLAAHDVDGDHRPELVATEAVQRGSAFGRRMAIRVWKQDARRGFHRLHQRRGLPGARALAHRGTVDYDYPADDSSDGRLDFLRAQESPVIAASIVIFGPSPRGPLAVPHHTAAPLPWRSRSPFGPRPPPTLHLA